MLFSVLKLSLDVYKRQPCSLWRIFLSGFHPRKVCPAMPDVYKRQTAGSYLLNAGMVLFGETPYNDLQMAVFAGTERLTFLDIQREHRCV